MGVGICLLSCCPRLDCVLLRNCDTGEEIITNTDLSEHLVADVLKRADAEGGGCWEILAYNQRCDEPVTFTPEGDPFTGGSACEDCLAETCICCGAKCAQRASGTWGFFLLNEATSQGVQCLENLPLPYGAGGWAGSSSDCGHNIALEIYCQDGQWLLDIIIGSLLNLTEVPVSGPGGWAIYWTDTNADYRDTFACCDAVEMTEVADSFGINVTIPACPD